jgi:alginate O-acetyltransferase complex protein AlgJ
MVTRTDSELSREARAHLEIGRTNVGRATVVFLLMFFLAAVAAVPAFEFASARASADGETAPWGHLSRLPGEMQARVTTARESEGGGAWSLIVARNRAALAAFHAFEDALEDESRIGRLLRPPAQLLMTAWLGAGNERAYVGREGWLFYRPDVEYVTGAPFLGPATLKRRIAAASEWTAPPQPNPRPAILAFKRQLEARGITLILMPTPLKSTVHPEKLARRYDSAPGPVHNPSYAALVTGLEREGVLIFDATTVVAQTLRASQASQYLATDTHWRPEAMEIVAARLAAFIRSHNLLPEMPSADYRAEPQEILGLGDIAVMLDLPDGQTLYQPETVTTRRVLASDGTPWRPSRSADVLVLGDSFSNIYSLASMRWGESAGLVEQLGYVLQRPIDRIVQNDEGAYATRAMLRRAGEERLAGKRVVIWQFAARELVSGDWRTIE